MNARDRKKQKRILEKKRELEAAKVAKEAEREAKRAKAQAEREAREAEKEAAWKEEVERLEAKKVMIAEMVMVRDWEGLRGEAIEGAVGFAMNWAGPVLAVGALAALPLASEIADYAAEILPFAGLGTVAYLARRWWRVRHPTIEELEEQLLEFSEEEEEEEERPRSRPQRRQRMAHIEDVAPPTLPLAYKKTVGFEMPRDILQLIESSLKPHLMITGETRSGKTTLIKHVIKARAAKGHKIVICDPHNVFGAWGPHDVRAGGANWEEYRQTLDGLLRYMNRVLAMLNEGKIKESECRLTTAYLGEWSWAQQEMGKDAANVLASLIMGSAKTGLRIVIDAQSDRVESLGIKGRGDLRDSLAQVKLAIEDGVRRTAQYEGNYAPTIGPFGGWAEPKSVQAAEPAEPLTEPAESAEPLPVSREPLHHESAVVAEPLSEPISVQSDLAEPLLVSREPLHNKSAVVAEPLSEPISVQSDLAEPLHDVSEPLHNESGDFEASRSTLLQQALSECGEDERILVRLALGVAQGHSNKKLMGLFKNKSSSLYDQRKEIIEFVREGLNNG